MTKLLSVKNDLVFKMLFTRNPDVLTDLINCVLNLSGPDRIVSVKILNPLVLPEEITKKFIVLDIRASDSSGREHDIEMQVRKYDSYPQRSLYYLCRMYSDQLKTGEDYSALRPVVGIHFLDYRQFEEETGFHYAFRLRDTRYPELVLTEDLSLHIFEFPGIEKFMKERKNEPLFEWLRFLSHGHEEGGRDMREYANPVIHTAFDALENLSADAVTRQFAEMREKALKDETTLLNEYLRKGERIGFGKGIEKGIEKEKKEMVKILLAMGELTVEKIAKIVRLSVEEIRKMEKEMTQP
ncbi:MAG: Rpn family recombination-promoting nuclease/putative transposase [Desulfobacterales bacterium]